MKTVTVENVRHTGYAPGLVSRLFAVAYLQHEKLHNIEEQIAKLNREAELERQKAREVETVIKQLVECSVNY
ncbi:MAG TPA: hypothetical protein VF596_19705 [Pyrinomonadaceae bacterium]|jgi:septal ring factor EnvC (AmiA/AmiB activator)